MNCPGCDRPLLPREYAQPMTVLEFRVRPASFCDECCRANPGRPGSPEALARLAAGVTDPAEAARVLAATADWLTTARIDRSQVDRATESPASTPQPA